MNGGRTFWAGLRLLDRQLVANDDRLAGCIDDLELSASDDGEHLYITAIISGPGGLAYRPHARRLGRWLRRFNGPQSATPNEDPTRIPFNLVSDITSHIRLGCDHDQVGIASVERWVRDHIVDHVPGADDESE